MNTTKTLRNKCSDCKHFGWARVDSGAIDRVCNITMKKKNIMHCCGNFEEKVYGLDEYERIVEVK